MLRVRQDCLRETGADRDAGFRGALRERLVVVFGAPPYEQGRDVVLSREQALWPQARQYGMRSKSDYSRYIHLMMSLWDNWPNSPDRPWISGVLLRKDISGTAKMDFIYTRMAEAA